MVSAIRIGTARNGFEMAGNRYGKAGNTFETSRNRLEPQEID